MARIKIEECKVEEVNLYKFDIEDLMEKFVVNTIKENNNEKNIKKTA
ncbi:hypothetical protein JCM1393_15540 [Clostridium carnis]